MQPDSHVIGRALGAIALLVALSGTGCGDEAAPDAPSAELPDVLLVVVDTLRGDHCTPYGYARPTTPNLARLAARGVLFETAYAPMGTTCPSHATLFTGQHVRTHGLDRNGLTLAPDARTLAERLADAGYATAGVVSSFPVSRAFGLHQGFDHFDDAFLTAPDAPSHWKGRPLPSGQAFERAPADTTDAALAWLEHAPTDRPRFLWAHYFDPHAPRADDHPEIGRFPAADDSEDARRRSRYDAEVRGVDHELGRLVDAFEAGAGRRGALVIVTADHGEALGEHGWSGHDSSTYDVELRIPLVMLWPGRLEGGGVCAQPAHLVDVAPTVCAALGLEQRDAGWEGVDLLPFARGAARADLERPLLLAQPTRVADQGVLLPGGNGLRAGRWKYFESRATNRFELYDLSADPGEHRNLVRESPAVARQLSRQLEALLRARPAGASPQVLDAAGHDELEALRALGYLGGGEGDDPERR